MEEDDGADDFCEEDIDHILSRRTTVIQHESEKGSSFSKASFSASSNRSDIELDDPDFWKKWAKKAEIDTDLGDKLRKVLWSVHCLKLPCLQLMTCHANTEGFSCC